MDECIHLASRVQDGDASVVFKRHKSRYIALAFFNLAMTSHKGFMGFITSTHGGSMREALEKLRDELVTFLERRRSQG